MRRNEEFRPSVEVEREGSKVRIYIRPSEAQSITVLLTPSDKTNIKTLLDRADCGRGGTEILSLT